MLDETSNIIKRKDALDALFPAEDTRGLLGAMLGKKGRRRKTKK